MQYSLSIYNIQRVGDICNDYFFILYSYCNLV